MTQPSPITVMYCNWRGERRTRHLQPISMWYGSTEWHPDPQWLIKAIDMDTGDEKDFALGGFLGEVPF